MDDTPFSSVTGVPLEQLAKLSKPELIKRVELDDKAHQINSQRITELESKLHQTVVERDDVQRDAAKDRDAERECDMLRVMRDTWRQAHAAAIQAAIAGAVDR